MDIELELLLVRADAREWTFSGERFRAERVESDEQIQSV
jgi:hypothetical protein